jgi:hypothetical protein
MALTNKFNRTTTAKPQSRASRYAGIQAAAPRNPYPHVGQYVFEIVSCEEGHNPGKGVESFKVEFKVVDLDERAAAHHAVGDVVFMSQRIAGSGSAVGLSRVKAFCMAVAGYDDEEAYDEFSPNGEFIDACVGAANAYSADGNPAVGTQVACMVGRGNSIPDSDDYYREYAWAPEHEPLAKPAA